MKTLSLIQPWATLIALGEKKIETRSWKTNYRGPLLIHAGMKLNKRICCLVPFVNVLNNHDIVFTTDFPKGSIIAKCELVDCLKIVDADFVSAKLENGYIVDGNENEFGDYTPGRYAWILENVEVLKDPIPAKGKLGLWKFDFKE